MKKIAIFLCAFLTLSSAAYAQHDTRAKVLSDIELAGGVHYLYPMNQPAPQPAPKGYKPFYLSHVGRHGSRFALGNTVYEELLSIWENGRQKGLLTPEGEEFCKAYTQLYPDLARREGQLTGKGQEQHRYIAASIYRNYPEIFKGKTHASAVSTVSHRVIVSMFSFMSELNNLDGDFSFDADYGHPYQAYLLPDVIDSGAERHGEAEAKFNRFRDEVLDLDGIVGRWFTQPDSVVTNKYKFVFDLHTMVSTLDNLDVPVPDKLYSLFTPEERYGLWRVNNYRDYQLVGHSPDTENLRMKAMKDLLNDFVVKADEDMASGRVQLRLRFAHDSTIMPLLSLMDINGMGISLANPYEVENFWQNFNVPMACNLQLVFFKSKKDPEILVQVLLNGFQARLPFAEAAPGFYKWSDFKAFYRQ